MPGVSWGTRLVAVIVPRLFLKNSVDILTGMPRALCSLLSISCMRVIAAAPDASSLNTVQSGDAPKDPIDTSPTYPRLQRATAWIESNGLPSQGLVSQ